MITTNHTYIVFIFNAIRKYFKVLVRFGAFYREGPRDGEVTNLSLEVIQVSERLHKADE